MVWSGSKRAWQRRDAPGEPDGCDDHFVTTPGDTAKGQVLSWRLVAALLLLTSSCTDTSQEPDASPTPEAVVIEGHEVQEFAEYGAQHHVGQSEDVSYRQTPPVAGPHSPVPAPCGVHGEAIPGEMMVHTLEHGAVGILFESTLPRTEIRAIERLARPQVGPIFSMPYEGVEGEVAVISWGRRMDLDGFDAAAVLAFIERFAGDAPEAEVGCHDFADDSFLDTSR